MFMALVGALTSFALCSSSKPMLTEIFAAGEKNVHGLSVVGYRIPGFLAIPAASKAGENNSAAADWLLVVAEARKYSCSDTSPHDLVAKRSSDGGATWSKNMMVVEPGVVWGAGEGGVHGGAVCVLL
jgi:Neuraminidase (sialidase)